MDAAMRLKVRLLESQREFEEAEQVQMSAWGMSRDGATPKEVMIAINDIGGAVLGAFDGQKMVGFALTLVGLSQGKNYLYSHQTGVVKEYQSKGVGFLLKQKQREVALERGFDLIAWTFDPIISRNAYFNFRKLGVVARNYLPDYYGPMDDSINFGWDTDRFLCEWQIAPKRLERVRSLARVDTNRAYSAIKKQGKEPYPTCSDWRVDLSAPLVLVDIPSDVVRLKTKDIEEGRRWRVGTREVFQGYFGAGYTAVALLEERGEYRYLLSRARMPKNIFSQPG